MHIFYLVYIKKLYILYIYQLNYFLRRWSTHIKSFLPLLRRVKLFWSHRHSLCMLRVVSAMWSLPLPKSPLSPPCYSEFCSKFRSKAHLQAATRLQLSGAFFESVAGYSTTLSGGDKGQLSCRARQGKAEFRGKGDREECALLISLMWSTQNESHVRQIQAKEEHLCYSAKKNHDLKSCQPCPKKIHVHKQTKSMQHA